MGGSDSDEWGGQWGSGRFTLMLINYVGFIHLPSQPPSGRGGVMARSAAIEGRRIAWAARRHEEFASPGLGRRTVGSLIAIVVVLAVWWAAVRWGGWSQIILPSPGKVWQAFIESVTVHDGRRGLSNEYLWTHLWASLWRILRGVFWAIVFGAPLGLVLGTWRPFELVAEPIVGFLRALPRSAISACSSSGSASTTPRRSGCSSSPPSRPSRSPWPPPWPRCVPNGSTLHWYSALGDGS